MVTKITCSDCGASLGIKGVVPASIDCPKCGAEIFTVTVDDDEPVAEETPKRKRRDEEAEEPRRKSSRNQSKEEVPAEDDKPARKSKAGNKKEEDADEPRGKKNKKQNDAPEKKKFPLYIPLAIGGAAVVVLVAVLIISGTNKDDHKATAKNPDNIRSGTTGRDPSSARRWRQLDCQKGPAQEGTGEEGDSRQNRNATAKKGTGDPTQERSPRSRPRRSPSSPLRKKRPKRKNGLPKIRLR